MRGVKAGFKERVEMRKFEVSMLVKQEQWESIEDQGHCLVHLWKSRKCLQSYLEMRKGVAGIQKLIQEEESRRNVTLVEWAEINRAPKWIVALRVMEILEVNVVTDDQPIAYKDLERAIRFVSKHEESIRKILGCRWVTQTSDLKWDDGGWTVRLNAILKHGSGHRITSEQSSRHKGESNTRENLLFLYPHKQLLSLYRA